MRVLLCGGAGYIGSHVAYAFHERGDVLGVYDNFSTGLHENILPGTEVYEGDIMDRRTLAQALSKNWDVLIHLAAFKAAGESMDDPDKYSQNNLIGSLNMIMEAHNAGVKSFILSSSAAVYGEPAFLPITEEHPCKPENYYGYTKLAIEEQLAWYDRLKGLKFVSLRYFNAAGYDVHGKVKGLERNPANLIPVVMEAALGLRKQVGVFGSDYPTPDGTGVRDYIHVTDLADAHVRAADYLQEKRESLKVNLGTGCGHSVLDIINMTEKISKRPVPKVMQGRRAGDPATLYASADLAEKTLGWKAKYSDLETIIASTCRAYDAHLGQKGI